MPEKQTIVTKRGWRRGRHVVTPGCASLSTKVPTKSGQNAGFLCATDSPHGNSQFTWAGRTVKDGRLRGLLDKGGGCIGLYDSDGLPPRGNPDPADCRGCRHVGVIIVRPAAGCNECCGEVSGRGSSCCTRRLPSECRVGPLCRRHDGSISAGSCRLRRLCRTACPGVAAPSPRRWPCAQKARGTLRRLTSRVPCRAGWCRWRERARRRRRWLVD